MARRKPLKTRASRSPCFPIRILYIYIIRVHNVLELHANEKKYDLQRNRLFFFGWQIILCNKLTKYISAEKYISREFARRTNGPIEVSSANCQRNFFTTPRTFLANTFESYENVLYRSTEVTPLYTIASVRFFFSNFGLWNINNC